jgi:light-regulated signal transduction histidine kinase (bacteriophytochrome)
VLLQKNEEFERSNQELASFSYVASHDLQEPLRKIQTFSHRIQEKEFERLSLQGKEYLTRMAAAAERMQALIEDLLTFSRTNTGPRVFQKTDLNKMMEQIISDLKDNIEEKSAVVEYKNLPSVHVVSFQFKQLMENLILNSLKYHKKNQPPHIKIKAVPAKGNLITEWDADKNKIYYVIEIKDNGIGFEQRYATKIFELFQRLHGKSEYPGTGLGLAICKKIIQNHHGFIIAKGEPGKGASFIIYLPE